jgi:GNAT superfamily N-acetyltransferase
MLRLVTLRVYERRLDALAAPAALPPGIEVAVLEGATAPRGDRWHPEADRRFADGHACAVARQNAVIVAYCWLASTPVPVSEINHVVVPGPDDVYLYDAFTAPAWRGRRLFPALLSRLLAFASAQGRKRALIFADSRNTPSCRAIERAGFELVQAVSWLEVCRLARLWLRGPRARSSRVVLVRDHLRR